MCQSSNVLVYNRLTAGQSSLALFGCSMFVLCCRYQLKKLHGPSMLAVKAKIYRVLYKQSSSIAFHEISSHWAALKSS